MRRKQVCGQTAVALVLAVLLTGCGGAQKETAVPVQSEQTEAVRTKTDDTGQTEAEEPAEVPDLHDYEFTCAFAGDINLAENWSTMEFYSQQENGIYDCIDPQLIQEMRRADLACVNVEFCLSDGGTPMEGKKYTFRAKPERAEILKELGVDLANLANNHIYDYGTDAFLDTLSILDENGIAHVGAGADAEEAEEPFYTEMDGRTVAVVSATRAEKYILTPEAGEGTPGVFRCYDMTEVLQKVREAKEQADIVIAYIHWGTEYSETLEDAQTEGAKALVDAGADVVLGAHPHCLQGIEFYGGKPILYSLGNYWFNEKTLDTVLVKLRFYGNEEEQHTEVQLLPARQEQHVTRLLTDGQEVSDWRSHMESMDPGTVQIDEKGIISNAN